MDFQPKKVEFSKTNFTLNFSPQISYLSAIRLFKGNGGSIFLWEQSFELFRLKEALEAWLQVVWVKPGAPRRP